jgi:tyramine---L-glutamate ligase
VDLLIVEYITGGGLLPPRNLEPGPLPALDAPNLLLLREGKGMLQALVEDCAECSSSLTIHTLRDVRCREALSSASQEHVIGCQEEWIDKLGQLGRNAAGVLLIAPESQGVLSDLAERMEGWGAHLLSPSAAFCRCTSDKHVLSQLLQSHHVPSPAGCSVQEFLQGKAPRHLEFPCVLKPFDGAGSQRMALAHTAGQVSQWVAEKIVLPTDRMETYVPGIPASIAALCREDREIFPLVPCLQHLTHDGGFHYLGGELITKPELRERAERLVHLCTPLLSKARGYVGIDFIYGHAQDGRDDVVIEINPRLTTSFIGLRQRASENLAAWMLSPILGDVRLRPRFKETPCVFRSNGELVT